VLGSLFALPLELCAVVINLVVPCLELLPKLVSLPVLFPTPKVNQSVNQSNLADQGLQYQKPTLTYSMTLIILSVRCNILLASSRPPWFHSSWVHVSHSFEPPWSFFCLARSSARTR